MSDLYADVESMFRAHRISGSESPIVTNGYSGARFSSIESGGARYITKRVRFADDWIMRETRDDSYREAEFAVSPIAARLPAGVAVPTLAASTDGDGRAILMRDISPDLLPDDGTVSVGTMDLILRRMAELHAAFAPPALDDAWIHWCDLFKRVTFLSPEAGAQLVADGRDFGLARGWDVFQSVAPAEAVALIQGIRRDPRSLFTMLASVPTTLLHGDLKLANMGIGAGGMLWLFDWALVSKGPVAVDLAWFLAVNASRLPFSFEETVMRYETHLREVQGVGFTNDEWMVQFRGIAIVGLLLYGWGKALDAEAGRPNELDWWCERALQEAPMFGL